LANEENLKPFRNHIIVWNSPTIHCSAPKSAYKFAFSAILWCIHH
jgi:hypothetical protein